MMATTLMETPCGEYCDEEAEYLVSFVITSLEMNDSKASQGFADVLVVITWDGNVVKLSNNKPDAEEFEQGMDLVLHSTANLISKKLKSSPIMFNLSRGCSELGTLKLDISNCFADAVLCEEFNSQTVTDEFKFIKDGKTNATMNAYFRVQRMLDEGIGQQVYQAFNSQINKKKKTSSRKKAGNLKKSKKTMKKSNKNLDDLSDDQADDDSDFETKSEDDLSEDEACKDFACPDEMTERCMREMGLQDNIYRIINGHLINTKDRTGPCGKKCQVAEKYLKEMSKAEKESSIPLSNRFEFNDGFSNCCDLFETSEDNFPSISKEDQKDCFRNIIKQRTTKKHFCRKNNWIDRNIHEEDLLKKLCKKYQIDVDEIRDYATSKPIKATKVKKGKKIKKRKCKKLKKVSPCDPVSYTEPTRKEFIKMMKRKARGKYSYEFGNKYPLHRACSNIEQGSGDALVIPKFMGWRWDIPMLGIGNKKWFPGRINKTVHCLMKRALNPFPHDTIPLTRRDKNGHIIKSCNDLSNLPETNPELMQKPTLQISKRNGEYFIKMNPLKSKDKLETDCNPFLNCSPLKFSIKKNPEEIKKHQAKKLLRQRGLTKKCSCTNMKCCRCLSETTKQLIIYEMKQASERFKLNKELTFDDLSESSDSELDLEFTTPSAIIDRRKCKKADVVHCGTQYEVKDVISQKVKALVKEGSKLEKDKSKLKKNKDKSKTDKDKLKPTSKLADSKKSEKQKVPEKFDDLKKKDPKKKSILAKSRIESIYIDPPCKPLPTCRPLWC